MIGKLTGIIDSTDEDHAVIDVHGVGYSVLCSARTLSLLAPGEAARLVIETHVREDHIHLFGFMSVEEREWFRLLSTVQRVGAKVALAILSAHTPAQIAHAIIAGDNSAFSRISGIGGKLAERIVAELKDKAVKLPVGSPPLPAAPRKKTANDQPPATDALEDTISALTHLGYSRSEAYTAALSVAREVGAGAPLNELITKSLKELAG